MKLSALFAEFLATFLFVFLGVGSMVAANVPGSAIGALGPALVFGLAIAVLASATAHISGGQLNPAITLACWLANRVSLFQAVVNIMGQVLGAFLAVRLLEWGHTAARLEDVSYGVPRLGPAIGLWPGLVFEALLTFVLALVVFGTMVDSRAPRMGALFVGLTVTIACLTIGPMTGASLNPARYLGPALVSGNFAELTVYLGGPIIGAGLAALVYTYGIGRPDPETK